MEYFNFTSFRFLIVVPLRKKSVDDSKNKRHLSPARGPTRKPPTTYEDKERMVKEHMKLTPEQILQNEKKVWTRSAPGELKKFNS